MSTKKNKKASSASHPQPVSGQKSIVRVSVVLLSFLVIGYHLFTGIDTAPFHVDEVGWVSAGWYFYQLMFIDHDFEFTKWDAPAHRTFGAMNLAVGKYLIGLGMHLALPPGEYFYAWDFSKNNRENLRSGNVPPLEVMLPARVMSAVFAFATCICMFWFCTLVWNWLVGIGASLILGFNSLFTLYAHRVMTDSYLVFFFLLTIALLALLIVRLKDNDRDLPLLSALYAVATGLLISVKFNGALGVVYLFAGLLYIFYVRTDRTLRRGLLYLGAFVGVLLLAGIVVVVINPYLYSTSIDMLYKRAAGLVQSWHDLLIAQTKDFSKVNISGFSVAFLSRIGYDHLHIVFAVLALAGLAVSVRQFVQRLVARRLDRAVVPLIFLVVNLVAVAVWITIDWDRYYLPVIIALVPFASFGAFAILVRVVPNLSRRWLGVS